MKLLRIFLPLLALISCGSYAPLDVVPHVDLNRYTGRWYEIASFPQSFQKGCTCTTAEYLIGQDGIISVLNTCRLEGSEGQLKTAQGTAFVTDTSSNAKLKVQFRWPFKGDYWIIDLADDYSYAVVGHPNRDYLWILSRKPTIETPVYLGILDRIKAKGFDIARLKITDQKCK